MAKRKSGHRRRMQRNAFVFRLGDQRGDERRVLDHVREWLPRRDLAGEGEESRTHRVA
jgi:hypothetical protein